MKSGIGFDVSSRFREPPTCGLILDAVEQFRQDPQSFQLMDIIRRYEAPDGESSEAFMAELERAIRLETLFTEFRKAKIVCPDTRRQRERKR
jgi:hypothetical protein